MPDLNMQIEAIHERLRQSGLMDDAGTLAPTSSFVGNAIWGSIPRISLDGLTGVDNPGLGPAGPAPGEIPFAGTDYAGISGIPYIQGEEVLLDNQRPVVFPVTPRPVFPEVYERTININELRTDIPLGDNVDRRDIPESASAEVSPVREPRRADVLPLFTPPIGPPAIPPQILAEANPGVSVASPEQAIPAPIQPQIFPTVTAGQDDMSIDLGGIATTIGDFIPGTDLFEIGGAIYNAATASTPPPVVVPFPTNTGSPTVQPVPSAAPTVVRYPGYRYDPIKGRYVKTRRRRRKLLTECDYNDLLKIQTLKNTDNVKIALAKSLGRC